MEEGIIRKVKVLLVVLVGFMLISAALVGSNMLGLSSQGGWSPENPLSSGGNEQPMAMNFVDISTGLPAGTYNFVAFGNFNGDAFVDMAFGAEDYSGGIQGLYAYAGNGGTSWNNQSTGLPGLGTNTFGGLSFGDADNDGVMDLYAGYEHWGSGFPDFGVGAWEYNGGSWSSAGITSPYTSGGVDNLVLKDVTGSSGLDLVIASDSGIKYYEGSGSSPISWTPYMTGLPNSGEHTALAVGDMNKDGRSDIWAGTYINAGVRFYTQDPSGTSWTQRPHANLTTSGNILGLAIGDVNNDNHLDLVYGLQSGGMHIRLGNSGDISGTNFDWTMPPLPGEGLPASATAGTFAQIQLADFDKDNDLDLLAPKTSGGLHLYLGNGSTNPGNYLGWTELLGAGLPTTGQYYGSNYADIDNDGDLDIGGTAWNNVGAHAWRNDLTGVDVWPPYSLSQSPTGIGVPVNTDFFVQWNETMNWNSVNSSFSYTDGFTVWDSTAGTFTHDSVAYTSTFNPLADLSSGTTYTVTFTTVATDPTSNPLDQNQNGIGGEPVVDELSWSFTTVLDANPPQISNVLDVPDSQVTGGSVNISASVTDDVLVDEVWVNITDPLAVSSNNSMTRSGATDTYFYDSSYFVLGTYTYIIWANDTSDNWNSSPAGTFDIIDPLPPEISGALVDGQASKTVLTGTVVTLTATVDDTNTGNSNIGGANYTVGAASWPGAGMTAVIPPFDNPVEDVAQTVDTTGWSTGTYLLCVYAWDVVPNDNVTSSACATLIVSLDVTPPEVSNVQLNGAPSQSYPLSSVPLLTLTAIIDDALTGASNIGGANFTVGPAQWPGTAMDPVDVLDSPTEGVTKAIASPTAAGVYYYYVYGWDDKMNFNTTSTSFATLTLTDDLVPEITSVLVDGLASANYGISSLPSTVTLTAAIDDSSTGGSNIWSANFTTAPALWPGTSMGAQTPPFDSPVEVATYTITTPQVPGTYHYYVYAWDAVPNYNNSAPFATLVINDDMAPEVSNVLVDGLASKAVSAGTVVTLNATIDDSGTGNSNIGGANYTIGSQSWPGIQMNAVLAPFDSPTEDVTVSISTTGWLPGSYNICVYAKDSVAPVPNLNLTSTAFATIIISSTSNTAPMLNWTGETNFESDGLNPETGNTSTEFVFRVKYTDAENNAPQAGHPKVVILRNGTEIMNETMDPVNASDTNYADGKLYTKTLELDVVSDEYSYYFMANDSAGLAAQTPVKNAPDVAAFLDSDGDGLPDSWEQEQFGNLTQNAAGDPDGDGYTNLQEWQNGTNPLVSDKKAATEFPWWILVVIIVLVVVILLLLLFVMRRRKKKAEVAATSTQVAHVLETPASSREQQDQPVEPQG